MEITQEEIDAVPDDCATEWEPMALAICHKIESMGCSPELTELSIMASNLHKSIVAFNGYCADQVDKMCHKNPHLARILRPSGETASKAHNARNEA